MSEQREFIDAVVVGAGVVGSALALGLAQQRKQVLLLEAGQLCDFQAESEYDLRVFAISLASEQLFRSLDVWDGIAQRRACAYTNMAVWDEAGDGRIAFSAEDVDYGHLGHIIENKVLVNALQQQARASELISLACGVTVLAGEACDDGWLLSLSDGRQLKAGLLIGADGARSSVRQIAGIETSDTSYEQKGIVAVVRTERSHQSTAWQRFLSTGPIAFLPLGNGCSSIVWSADMPLAEELMNLDDAAFAQRLAQAFEHQLGDVSLVSQRAAFPLKRMHARQYICPSLALVGDAAHTIHPLAGQGVNLGLMDVAVLLEELANKPRPFPAQAALRRYERRRKHGNQLVQSGMDFFHYGFRSEQSLLQTARNKGMTMAGQTPILRRQFARTAAGLDGDVPALARVQRKPLL